VREGIVLIVEDNAAMRGALAETLKVLDYRTLEAGNGLEALKLMEKSEILSAEDPDQRIILVLSDMTMPVMDGQDLLHELRNRGIVTPVILLTGYLSGNELDELKSAGLSGWLIKPVGIDQIATMMDKLLI